MINRIQLRIRPLMRRVRLILEGALKKRKSWRIRRIKLRFNLRLNLIVSVMTMSDIFKRLWLKFEDENKDERQSTVRFRMECFANR
mmetsp:Transcript_7886/g.14305  ORF Transcript_7886/g.14305 Transcript_7886/m.14305 type:complete len:86 (-) Transcript_7886:139-396(-)